MSDESTNTGAGETEATGWSGHVRMNMDELATLAATGLAIIMPRISRRYWTMYYAAKESNWTLAKFQAKEIQELMETGAYTRPKYEKHLEEFMNNNLKPLISAIESKNWETFEKVYQEGVNASNQYHDANDKGFLVWQLPSYPPPELDLSPKD